jgi:hypothetical protein
MVDVVVAPTWPPKQVPKAKSTQPMMGVLEFAGIVTEPVPFASASGPL